MPTYSQKQIELRSSVYGVFYSITNTPPSATDDRNKSFIRGSRWIDVAAEKEYVCVGNEPTNATWIETTATGGGGSSPHTSSSDPTVNDDTGDGYVVGQVWVNTTTDTIFVAADVTAAAAVWVNVSGSASSPVVTTSAPTVNDDSGDGYTIGQMWVNTATDIVYVATDVSVGAALWKDISTIPAGMPSVVSFASSPTVNDDSGDGYVVGQVWINTANNNVFIAKSVSSGAAVWINLTTDTTGMTPVNFTTDPGANDDSGDGYGIGQLWVNTSNGKVWVARSVTPTSAVWVDVTVTGGGGGGSGDNTLVEAAVMDLVVSNITQSTTTAQFPMGDVVIGTTLDGTLGGADTTFVLDTFGNFTPEGYGVVTSTNIISGLTATRSTSGTTAILTDGSTATYDQMTTAVPMSWRFDLGSGVTKRVGKVSLYQYYDGNNSIKNFKIQGSSDNTNWTDVYAGVMPNTHASYVDFTFTPLVSTAFRYWRILVESRDSTQTSSTLYELRMFEIPYTTVTDPVITTVTHSVSNEPQKAVVGIVADIGTFALNTTFVCSISNNSGTNYDTVTLVDSGVLLPYSSPFKLYTAIAPITDRDSSAMRIKIACTGTASCKIKAIAVEYLKSFTSGGGGGMAAAVSFASSPTVNDDSSDGYAIGQIWINTATNNVFIAKSVGVGAAVWLNLSTAANITADADPYLTGTTVQSQLTSISNMFRGASGFIRSIPAIGYFTLTTEAVRNIQGYYVT